MLDTAAGASRASGQPQLPAQRPTWMVVLASLMVVFAFHLFLGGLDELTGGPPHIAERASSGAPVAKGSPEATEALRRALASARAAANPTLLRIRGASNLVFAALLVFAVAAIATRDRRGRPVALLAAWVGVGYHVLGAALFIAVERSGLLATGNEWIEQLAALATRPGADPLTPQEARAGVGALLVVWPVGLALLGVGFSAAIIAFFGGARGRSYYGVPVASEGEARPGV
jgi:hypothetical protein